MKNRGGQVTIFIIIAVLVVAFVAIFFIFRGQITTERIPANIQPVETFFLNCLEDDVLTGIDVLESQGGYIQLPEFEPGSEFMPFSSQLDFLGNPIPYWYYVSGNNLEREQIPSKRLMEGQLASFVEDEIANCAFNNFYTSGYEIVKGIPNANVLIRDGEVEVNLEMDLEVNFQEQNAVIPRHSKIIKSNLGSLYDSAKSIYDYEQENLFLEERALDTLRLYAPVDGVEVSCSPLTWSADEVFTELEEAIEINTLALNNQEQEDYFNLDLSINPNHEAVFINSKQWPKTFEVLPSVGNILLSNPIGNQPGLGILGFCYVPYHFVYNVKYPVLIQVVDSSTGEVFQFPMAVILQGNNPRESLNGSAGSQEIIGLCENRNTPINVNVLDAASNPVDAEIFYECFGERCMIGSGSSISEEFPQCANGQIIANADGFKESRETFSTISEGSLTIYLEEIYELPVNLKIGGIDYDGEAIISFTSDEFSSTVIYPEQNTAKLSEGFYNVEVYVYRESELQLEASVIEQCTDVQGIFGITRKKCFDVEIPSQVISKVLSGGGQQEYFILNSELEGTTSIEINVNSLPLPTTIEQLQDNYVLFELNGVDLKFK